jgi:hypothetical protein
LCYCHQRLRYVMIRCGICSIICVERERSSIFSRDSTYWFWNGYAYKCNSVRHNFRQANISCCRFHLGQSMWHKIQTIGFSAQYRQRFRDWEMVDSVLWSPLSGCRGDRRLLCYGYYV